jgi:peroxiredoxin
MKCRMRPLHRPVALIALLALAAASRAQSPPSKSAPHIGQKVADFALPDSSGKKVQFMALLAEGPTVQGDEAEIRGVWAVLIFYRGSRDLLSASELQSFQDNLEKFNSRSARVIAISADSPEVTQKWRKEKGFTFTLLCDPKAEVIRGWDLLEPHGGPGGADVSRPAEFVIDPSGAVRWVNLNNDPKVGIQASAVLKVLYGLHAGEAPAEN